MRPRPLEYHPCECGRRMFLPEHWAERPSILDAYGQHAQAPSVCVHWASLPDEVAAVCKRVAGTLSEVA